MKRAPDPSATCGDAIAYGTAEEHDAATSANNVAAKLKGLLAEVDDDGLAALARCVADRRLNYQVTRSRSRSSFFNIGRLRSIIRAAVISRTAYHLGCALVLISAGLLASWSLAGGREALIAARPILTALFALETTLKLAVYGPRTALAGVPTQDRPGPVAIDLMLLILEIVLLATGRLDNPAWSLRVLSLLRLLPLSSHLNQYARIVGQALTPLAQVVSRSNNVGERRHANIPYHVCVVNDEADRCQHL